MLVGIVRDPPSCASERVGMDVDPAAAARATAAEITKARSGALGWLSWSGCGAAATSAARDVTEARRRAVASAGSDGKSPAVPSAIDTVIGQL